MRLVLLATSVCFIEIKCKTRQKPWRETGGEGILQPLSGMNVLWSLKIIIAEENKLREKGKGRRTYTIVRNKVKVRSPTFNIYFYAFMFNIKKLSVKII